MKILIDTDVLLDLALNRTPYADDAASLIEYLEEHPYSGFIAWHSVANFYSLARPVEGGVKTKRFISDLLEFLSIASTTTRDVQYALSLPFNDFEDALQVAAAVASKASCIVTRNTKDSKKSPLQIFSPRQVLRQLLQ